jgi:hypothetical protein
MQRTPAVARMSAATTGRSPCTGAHGVSGTYPATDDDDATAASTPLGNATYRQDESSHTPEVTPDEAATAIPAAINSRAFYHSIKTQFDTFLDGELQAQRQVYQVKFDEQQQALQHANDEVAGFQGRNTVLSNEVETLVENERRLREDLEVLTNTNTTNGASLTLAEADVKKLTDRVSQLESANRTLRKTAIQTDAEYKKLHDKATVQEKRLSDTEQTLAGITGAKRRYGVGIGIFISQQLTRIRDDGISDMAKLTAATETQNTAEAKNLELAVDRDAIKLQCETSEEKIVQLSTKLKQQRTAYLSISEHFEAADVPTATEDSVVCTTPESLVQRYGPPRPSDQSVDEDQKFSRGRKHARQPSHDTASGLPTPPPSKRQARPW